MTRSLRDPRMKTRKRSLKILVILGSLFCAALTLILLAGGCSGPPELDESNQPSWFEDVTKRVRLDFQHECGALPVGDHFYMPQLVGSGAALFDYDNDGRLDIYLIQNGGANSTARNRLFHQEKDGTFTDV